MSYSKSVYHNYTATIRSGDSFIIDSGSVISYGDSFVELESKIEGELLILRFTFHKDEKGEGRIEWSPLPDATSSTLEIRVFNSDSGLDNGNPSAFKVATIGNGKKVYLNFRVRKSGDSRTIDCTLYLLI